MSDRRYRLGVVAVFAVAVAMRSLPLWRSPLPFKADGLFYAAEATDALALGRLPLARMATDDAGFASLLVELSLVTGVDPWLVAQPASSLIGALPVLIVIPVARRVCRHRGWSVERARLAGLLAGAFLAVEGLYLHRAMVTDEQTAGLFVVPLALFALHRATATDRPAWWLAGVALLALLPPLHNLDAMVAAIAMTGLVGVAAVRGRPARAVAKLALLTAGFWVVFPAYHVLTERFTPAVIIQEARFTEIPGLVGAWMLVGVLALAWATRLRPRTQRLAGWSVFGAMFGLLVLNAWRAVFPEMPRTPPVVLALLLPLAIPAALAAWRGPDLQGGDGPPMLALGAAATVVIGVSLTAALTPVYLGTAYRTSLFLHVPVAVPVGVGVAAAMDNRRVAGRPSLRVGVAAAVLVSAVVSAPLAFGGLAPFNYRAVTPPAELAGAEFARSHVEGPWAADDHTRRVAGARFEGGNATVTPVFDWLVDGRPPPDCATLLKRSWSTRGTQFLTTGVIRLPEEAYERWRATSHVVYDGGGRDRISLGLPRGHAAGC